MMSQKNTISLEQVGILGYGEVGSALARFYDWVLVKDIDRDEFVNPMDFIHVCIPYSDKFIDILRDVQAKYCDDHTIFIIHSTVPVGTTWKVSGEMHAVHSPVRGTHPNIFEGIKQFVKYIGTDILDVGRRVRCHFERMGIGSEPVVIKGSKNTEFAKILCTTYYGWCIMFEKEMFRLCKENGIDYNFAYRQWNESYNEGFDKWDRNVYIRPVLKHMPGKIGGHCVINNAKILDTMITKVLLEYDGKL